MCFACLIAQDSEKQSKKYLSKAWQRRTEFILLLSSYVKDVGQEQLFWVIAEEDVFQKNQVP